jgi:hypothetical protein
MTLAQHRIMLKNLSKLRSRLNALTSNIEHSLMSDRFRIDVQKMFGLWCQINFIIILNWKSIYFSTFPRKYSYISVRKFFFSWDFFRFKNFCRYKKTRYRNFISCFLLFYFLKTGRVTTWTCLLYSITSALLIVNH